MHRMKGRERRKRSGDCKAADKTPDIFPLCGRCPLVPPSCQYPTAKANTTLVGSFAGKVPRHLCAGWHGCRREDHCGRAERRQRRRRALDEDKRPASDSGARRWCRSWHVETPQVNDAMAHGPTNHRRSCSSFRPMLSSVGSHWQPSQ